MRWKSAEKSGQGENSDDKIIFLECKWPACLYGKRFSGVFREGTAGCAVPAGNQDAAASGEFEFPGYEIYWNSAVKKGYSGTAVLTKEKPVSVSYAA